MWVKICGNTNVEDAQFAAGLGADAVGFVFAASVRQVTAAQVAAIAPRLPAHIERVGVFDSRDADRIAGVALAAGLTAVQLHGGLDEELSARLAERFAGRVRIIQTLHWQTPQTKNPQGTSREQPPKGITGPAARPATESSAVGMEPSAVGTQSPARRLAVQIERIAALGTADRVLIDSKVGEAVGGTGVAFDWAAAREAFSSEPNGTTQIIPVILAGGLRPDNVARAIAQLAPWGVDVSSGVEASPGHKDRALVARFIEQARAGDTA